MYKWSSKWFDFSVIFQCYSVGENRIASDRIAVFSRGNDV